MRTTAPEPILVVNPRAHPGLARIAEWAMERELCNRYASMNYMIADLDRVAQGQEPLGPHGQAPGPGPHWRRRLASVLGLGLAAVLILLGAALVFPDPFYRRLPPGSLDPAFGTGGKVYTDVGTQSEDRCSAISSSPTARSWPPGAPNSPARASTSPS